MTQDGYLGRQIRNAQAVEALNAVLGPRLRPGARQKVAKVWAERVVAAVVRALTWVFGRPRGTRTHNPRIGNPHLLSMCRPPIPPPDLGTLTALSFVILRCFASKDVAKEVASTIQSPPAGSS